MTATPTRQPQEGYYLITKNEWNTLYNMDQNDFVIDLLERVRSRTHTSPAPATDDYPHCPYHRYQCRYEFVGEVTPEHHYCKRDERIILTMAKEREAGAKAAREQVLDELRNWVDSICWHNSTGYPFDHKVPRKCELLAKFESLRAQQQGGVSE